jgi:hypothetical protein
LFFLVVGRQVIVEKSQQILLIGFSAGQRR